jgi:hypothetical protein
MSAPIRKGLSRRELLQSAAAVVPVSLTGCATLSGDELPLVRNSDPVALAMAYYSDTRDVPADNPLATNHDVSQKCANCVHARGNMGPDRIFCGTFPGRTVSPDGWCSIWAQG